MDEFTFNPPIFDPNNSAKLAQEAYDWLRCAESWLKIFENKGQALLCAHKAEDCAGDYVDWHMCCDFWLSVIPDLENAQRCILQAEKAIEVSSDLSSFPSYWLRIGNTV